MAANPFFSGRIPQELFDHIEKRIEKSGESKTDILVQALAIYTGFDLPIQKEITQSPLTEKITNLSNEIEILKDEIKAIKLFQKQQQDQLKQKESIVQHKEKEPFVETISLPLFPDKIDDNLCNNSIDNEKEVKILNTKEAAKLLKLKVQTIYNWNNQKKLPKIVNGFQLRLARKDKEMGYLWEITVITDDNNVIC
jgi:hypothetical protein